LSGHPISCPPYVNKNGLGTKNTPGGDTRYVFSYNQRGSTPFSGTYLEEKLTSLLLTNRGTRVGDFYGKDVSHTSGRKYREATQFSKRRQIF